MLGGDVMGKALVPLVEDAEAVWRPSGARPRGPVVGGRCRDRGVREARRRRRQLCRARLARARRSSCRPTAGELHAELAAAGPPARRVVGAACRGAPGRAWHALLRDRRQRRSRGRARAPAPRAGLAARLLRGRRRGSRRGDLDPQSRLQQSHSMEDSARALRGGAARAHPRARGTGSRSTPDDLQPARATDRNRPGPLPGARHQQRSPRGRAGRRGGPVLRRRLHRRARRPRGVPALPEPPRAHPRVARRDAAGKDARSEPGQRILDRPRSKARSLRSTSSGPRSSSRPARCPPPTPHPPTSRSPVPASSWRWAPHGECPCACSEESRSRCAPLPDAARTAAREQRPGPRGRGGGGPSRGRDPAERRSDRALRAFQHAARPSAVGVRERRRTAAPRWTCSSATSRCVTRCRCVGAWRATR